MGARFEAIGNLGVAVEAVNAYRRARRGRECRLKGADIMRLRVLFSALAIAVLSTVPASAQRPFGVHGWGPRAGVTINPDQIHLGAHLDLGDFAPRFQFLPNAEIGFGDHYTVLAPMFEVDYRFQDDWGSWNPYLGAGIGPVFAWRSGSSNTDIGITLQGGIARMLSSQAGTMFFEFKVGLADYPDVKFTVGWTFGNGGGGKTSGQ